MITQEQILKADGDELSRLLGQVLLSEQHGHVVGQSIEEMQFSYYHCTTCGEVNFETDSHCTLRPLIPLDWDNAMKYFGEIEDGDTISLTPRDKAMIEWFSMESEATGIPLGKILPERTTLTAAQNYLLSNLDPVDFLRIAAICKLERK